MPDNLLFEIGSILLKNDFIKMIDFSLNKSLYKFIGTYQLPSHCHCSSYNSKKTQISHNGS